MFTLIVEPSRLVWGNLVAHRTASTPFPVRLVPVILSCQIIFPARDTLKVPVWNYLSVNVSRLVRQSVSAQFPWFTPSTSSSSIYRLLCSPNINCSHNIQIQLIRSIIHHGLYEFQNRWSGGKRCPTAECQDRKDSQERQENYGSDHQDPTAWYVLTG